MRVSSTATILIISAAALALARTAVAAEHPASPATGDATAKPARRPLDLRPPDVTKLLTPAQLDRLLAKAVEESIEEVEVEAIRDRGPLFTPRVWPAIAAPFWAMLHPTQAWRILAPIPPDQARYMGERPDATASYYLQPAAVTAP